MSEATPSQPSGKGKGQRSNKRKERHKSVPQRTCVGCRAVRPKREMVRVVRAPDGVVTIDPRGKLSGRGAYICGMQDCWHIALKHRSLNHALKVTLDDHTTQALLAFAQTLPQSVDKSTESKQN